jgi:hypothetical protein
MTNDLFVDATTPFLRSDDGRTILLKTTSPNTWFHAPTSARMARGAGDRYLLNLIRSRHRKSDSQPDGTVTTGGILAAQVHLVALAATLADEAPWTVLLERHGHSPAPGSMFAFVPLSLWKGRMTVGGVDFLVDDSEAYRETAIGTPTSTPVTLRLNAHGADALRHAIDAGAGPPVAVRFDYEYDAWGPVASYQITADTLATHAVAARHLAAAAGYYGASGGQAELDAMCDELRVLGAAVITWKRTPDGFDAPRVVTMERAILQRWIKKALDRLVGSVEPDDEAPAGGSGGVVVRLKAAGDVEDVDLSERHDGQQFTTEPFSYSVNLGQLRGLLPSAYATDVEVDASVPIVLNFGRDSRVRRYDSHVGYRRSDGTVAAVSHEASGVDGLSVTDLVRWGVGEPRPASVEVRYSIEWVDPQWEGHSGKAVLETDVPCIAFSVSPGRRVAEVAVISDLASAERGALAAVTWSTELPPNDGVHPKNYSGSFFVDGMGAEGSVVRQVVAFPFQEGRESNSFFRWTAELALPNGAVLSRSKVFSLADMKQAGIFLADLRPT